MKGYWSVAFSTGLTVLVYKETKNKSLLIELYKNLFIAHYVKNGGPCLKNVSDITEIVRKKNWKKNNSQRNNLESA